MKATRSYKLKDLSRCRIAGRELGADPCTYDFKDANLSGALLFFGDFRSCDFTDATIESAVMGHMMVNAEQLASTKSYSTDNFNNVKITAKVAGTLNLSGMNLYGCQLWFFGDGDIDISDASIANCHLLGSLTPERLRTTASYKRGCFRGVIFQRVDLAGFDFSRMNLTGCIFSCKLENAKLEDAVISDVSFSSDSGIDMSAIQSTWNFKNGRMDGISS